MTHHATGAAPGPGGAAGVRAAEREPRHVPLRLPLQLQLRQRGEDIPSIMIKLATKVAQRLEPTGGFKNLC